jgi:ABC-type multidrug transport system fused ATPase/permease subunit
MKKPLNLALAVLVLLTALAMASVAAWQRADSAVDRVLLVALACVTVVTVHLLPSLTKMRMKWPLWVVCFLMAVYSHACFFSFASLKAGEEHTTRSKQALWVQAQQQTIADTLATIKARPLATVAAQLARTSDTDKRDFLGVEFREAKRAADLRDDLIRLGSVTDSSVVTEPVIALIANVTGISQQSALLMLYLVMAAMMELVGVLLWLELFNLDDVTPIPAEPLSPLDRLRLSVDSGECKPTVASIRQFMGCGQVRAMHLRREL